MSLRSILFVPGDSERKLARAASVRADAFVFDLEDSVAPSRKAEARALVRQALEQPRDGRQFWVRINALDSGEALSDLAVVTAGAPDVILLPKASGAECVLRLGHYLSALEARESLAPGRIGIVAIATETAAAMFGLGSYHPDCPRLRGLTWGAEDLSAAIGASASTDASGALTPLYGLARALCLAAASRAGTEAIDTPFMGIDDQVALEASCLAARRDGFTAKLAIHPGQVEVINRCFTASDAELALARRIVAEFERQPEVAAFQLDGRMIDTPHLKQARRILERRQGEGCGGDENLPLRPPSSR